MILVWKTFEIYRQSFKRKCDNFYKKFLSFGSFYLANYVVNYYVTIILIFFAHIDVLYLRMFCAWVIVYMLRLMYNRYYIEIIDNIGTIVINLAFCLKVGLLYYIYQNDNIHEDDDQMFIVLIGMYGVYLSMFSAVIFTIYRLHWHYSEKMKFE